MRPSCIASWVLAVLFTAPLGRAAGQEPLLLRFAPLHDVPVRIAFQTHSYAVGPDGGPYEVADLGLMTAHPLGVHDGAHVLHVTYDSVRVRVRVRVRARERGEPWREFAPPWHDSLWVQLRLDDRLRVMGTAGHGLPGLTDPIVLVTGARDLVLPERGLHVGGQWRSRIGVRLPRAPVDPALRSVESLAAETALMLDSVVARANDTLGYFTMSGQIDRTTVVDPYGRAPVRWSFAGEITGSLVWSTGWRAFVAGTSRARVHARRHEPGQRAEEDRLVWETTTRYHVRP